MLVARQEVEVHSPARMWPIRISTGIVLRGHCSFYAFDQERKWQCAHGCDDTVSMIMMRSLLGKGHARSIAALQQSLRFPSLRSRFEGSLVPKLLV
jgi:hypothetical protein